MNNLPILSTPATKPWPYGCPCQWNYCPLLTYFGHNDKLRDRTYILSESTHKVMGLILCVCPRQKRTQLFGQGKRRKLAFILYHIHIIHVFPNCSKVWNYHFNHLTYLNTDRKMRFIIIKFYLPESSLLFPVGGGLDVLVWSIWQELKIR